MDDKHLRGIHLITGLVVLAGVLYWLNARKSKGGVIEDAPANSGGFYAPYYWSTPGIYDSPAILNGASSPFESTVNVFVDNPALAGITNHYIPMFGFVGVTAVSA